MSPVRNFVNDYGKLAHLTACLDPVGNEKGNFHIQKQKLIHFKHRAGIFTVSYMKL